VLRTSVCGQHRSLPRPCSGEEMGSASSASRVLPSDVATYSDRRDGREQRALNDKQLCKPVDNEPRPVSCKRFRRRIYAGPLESQQPNADHDLTHDEPINVRLNEPRLVSCKRFGKRIYAGPLEPKESDTDEPRLVSCKRFRKRIYAGPLEPKESDTDEDLSDDESINDEFSETDGYEMERSFSSGSYDCTASFDKNDVSSLSLSFSDDEIGIQDSFDGWREPSTGL